MCVCWVGVYRRVEGAERLEIGVIGGNWLPRNTYRRGETHQKKQEITLTYASIWINRCHISFRMPRGTTNAHP